MFRLPEWRRLFRLPGWRRSLSDEVDQELEFHLAMRRSEYEAMGLDPEAARQQALARFGDVGDARRTLVRTDRRAARWAAMATWVSDAGRDVRFAWRELRRNRSLALVVVAVLGLGVGLSTAMMSVFDRLALHPLPYPEADRLGVLWLRFNRGEHSMRLNPDRAVREVVASTPGIERVDAHATQQVMADIGGTPEVMAARLVTPGLLSGLGARTVLGRLFAAEDTVAAALTTVLAHRTWRRQFGGRTDIVGTGIQLDGRTATVIGVLAPGFDLTSLDGGARAEVWLPLRADLMAPGQDRMVTVVTLAPGMTADRATREIDARMKAAAADTPASERAGPPLDAVILGGDQLVSKSLRKTLGLLVGAVGLVLLVACANVAALLLGQTLSRVREFGVREALGAGRGRVVRQLGAESLLLGGLGLAAGAVVGAGALALVRAVRPASLLTLDEVRFGGPTLLIAAAVALVSVLLFGLAPLWAVSRANAAAALVGRTRSGDRPGAGRLRTALVVLQLAVTLVLLAGAGLLLKSFALERNLPLGFDADGLSVIAIDLPEREFPTAALRAAVIDDVVERVRRVPGVIGATAAGNSPVDFGVIVAEFLPEGKVWPAEETKAFFPMRWVSEDYFAVIGLPLVAGRSLGPDGAAAEILIDEATARRTWGTIDVIGKRVRYSRDDGDWQTVVGVVANVRGLAGGFDEEPLVYKMAERNEATTLIFRTAGATPLASVSRTVRDAHTGLRIRSAATMPALLDERLAGDRFTLVIVAGFAVLTLGLAMVGLYGVLSYAVRQRQFEFGVRLALGARPNRVRSMVYRQAAVRIGAGMALGLLGSVGLVRLIRGLLYQMEPWDPWVFGAVAVGMMAVGCVAVWVPARRASGVDPLVSLRAE